MSVTDKETALWAVVTAWENLPMGRYPPDVIQRWLSEDMKPAIDEARRALVPNEGKTDG